MNSILLLDTIGGGPDLGRAFDEDCSRLIQEARRAAIAQMQDRRSEQEVIDTLTRAIMDDTFGD